MALHSRISPTITAEIIKLYNSGMSQLNIGKKLSINEKTVSNILHANNVHIRTNHEQALKYTFNENIFDVIDSPEKAYWLGFIYADGYITSATKHSNRKLGITLATSDELHLYKFRDFLQGNMPIHQYSSTSGYKDITLYSRIMISSPHLTQQLINKGVVEHKTELLTFPDISILPQSLRSHFIRGYLDGDGSIPNSTNTSTYSLAFCGTKEFLSSLLIFFNKSAILEQRHPDRETNNWQFKYGGNRFVESCLDILYENATTYLERKYAIYLSLKKHNALYDTTISEAKNLLDAKILTHYETLQNQKKLLFKLTVVWIM